MFLTCSTFSSTVLNRRWDRASWLTSSAVSTMTTLPRLSWILVVRASCSQRRNSSGRSQVKWPMDFLWRCRSLRELLNQILKERGISSETQCKILCSLSWMLMLRLNDHRLLWLQNDLSSSFICIYLTTKNKKRKNIQEMMKNHPSLDLIEISPDYTTTLLE